MELSAPVPQVAPVPVPVPYMPPPAPVPQTAPSPVPIPPPPSPVPQAAPVPVPVPSVGVTAPSPTPQTAPSPTPVVVSSPSTPSSCSPSPTWTARKTADPCACMYQGSVIAADIYTQYPSSNQGQYKDLTGIGNYGATCGIHDIIPGTPWHASCDNTPSGQARGTANTNKFEEPAKNWCQIPWCYVDSACSTAVASDVFKGSPAAHFSYEACGAVNCYTDKGTETTFPQALKDKGCPYGGSIYRYHKSGNCACKYHGKELESSIYTNFPSSNQGQYKNLARIQIYGTTCQAWDQMPGTPWYSSCPCNHDACTQAYNWCQLPWCYVESTCPDAVASSVFKGSTVAHYSYDTCKATDCYNLGVVSSERSWKTTCPWQPGTAGWYTKHLTCPNGWTDTKAPVPAPAPAPAGGGGSAPSVPVCPSCTTDTDTSAAHAIVCTPMLLTLLAFVLPRCA